MRKLGGKTLVLDRDNINTDEIIPARYLTEVEKKAVAPYILEDLEMEGFDPKSLEVKQNKVVVSRANFGCGSSREHAVWVFTENGYEILIAENFARIFRQNSYNNGLLAIELPKAEIDRMIAARKKNGELEILADLDSHVLEMKSGKESWKASFEISPFYKEVVKAGGWINYADKKY